MTAAENIAANVGMVRSRLLAAGYREDGGAVAALDALAADLETLAWVERERDFWKGRYDVHHGTVHRLEERVETLTRERGEWKAKYEARAEAQPSDVEFYGR